MINKQKLSTYIIILLIFTQGILIEIIVNKLYLSNSEKDYNCQKRNEKTDQLKFSGHWILDPFIIDDTGSGDYTWEDAALQPWCNGSGTKLIPYTIENIAIDAGGSGSCLIIKNSDVYFTIKNSTISNCGKSSEDAGINLNGIKNGLIENNTFFENWIAIRLVNSDNNLILNNSFLGGSYIGIFLYSNCQYNKICKNIIRDGSRAIRSYGSNSNNTVYNNTMISNGYGTYLEGQNNTIIDNILKKNGHGIACSGRNSKIIRNKILNGSLYGLDISYSRNAQIINNTVNFNDFTACHLYKIDDSKVINNTVSFNGYNEVSHGVTIGDSSNVLFFNNTLTFNSGTGLIINSGDYGVSEYNQIIKNKICNNGNDGISLGWSSHSIIKENKINQNGRYGMNIKSSNKTLISENTLKDDFGGPYAAEFYITGNNNSIFANYFINPLPWIARDSGNDNQWNCSNIGNFWSSYTGVDTDDDGIGDTPYIYYSIIDYLPIWWDPPILLINSPKQDEICEIRPSFNISIVEGIANATWYSLDSGIKNVTFKGLTGNISQSEWNKLDEGPVFITFYVNDSRGFENSTEVQIIKEYDIPQITIILPSIDHVSGFNAPKFNITIEDRSEINATWYTIDGGLTNFTFYGLNGTINQTAWDKKGTELITLTFYANDSLGHIGFKDVVIWKDLTKPIIIINSPISNQLCGIKAPSFDINVVEPNILKKWYSLNGSQNIYFTAEDQFNQSEWDKIGNGTAIITFFAEDKAGNLNNSEVIIRKDAYIPVIEIHSPLENEIFGMDAPNFTITITEIDLVSVWYEIEEDSTKFHITEMKGVIDQDAWYNAPEGEILIKFYAQDAAGNVGMNSVMVIKEIASKQPKSSKSIISGYNLFILLSIIGVVTFIIFRKIKKKNH